MAPEVQSTELHKHVHVQPRVNGELDSSCTELRSFQDVTIATQPNHVFYHKYQTGRYLE